MIQSRSCACYASVCQRDQTLSLTDCPCTSSSHHRLLNATIAPVHMKRYLPKCVLFFYADYTFTWDAVTQPRSPWFSAYPVLCVCVSTNTESPASLPINNKHVPSKLRERPTSTRLQMQRNACHPCKSLFPCCSYPLQYKFKGSSSSSVSYFIQCTIMRSQRAGWSRKVKLPLWMYGSV